MSIPSLSCKLNVGNDLDSSDHSDRSSEVPEFQNSPPRAWMKNYANGINANFFHAKAVRETGFQRGSTPQIDFAETAELSLLVHANGIKKMTPGMRTPESGLYLDKYQSGVLEVEGDDVQLTESATPVSLNQLIANGLQMFGRFLFPLKANRFSLISYRSALGLRRRSGDAPGSDRVRRFANDGLGLGSLCVFQNRSHDIFQQGLP